jgi:peptidoglycan-associated lipoprotein
MLGRRSVWAWVALAAVCSAACGSDPKPPPAAVPPAPLVQPQEPAPPPPPPEKLGDDPRQSTINLSDEIRVACGISDAEARFAYDSARVRAGDQPILNKLVQCFTKGRLSGRLMRLVGHADPRGEPEYNMVLGGRRAENVRVYLMGQGMGASQAETTSRGELDAQGHDEATWDQDRRVDVVLAN